jgi:surface antigen
MKASEVLSCYSAGAMTKNKDYRKQLEGQYRALEEHLEKIAAEQRQPVADQDLGLIAHWEKTVANCRQQIAKLERRLNR